MAFEDDAVGRMWAEGAAGRWAAAGAAEEEALARPELTSPANAACAAYIIFNTSVQNTECITHLLYARHLPLFLLCILLPLLALLVQVAHIPVLVSLMSKPSFVLFA